MTTEKITRNRKNRADIKLAIIESFKQLNLDTELFNVLSSIVTKEMAIDSNVSERVEPQLNEDGVMTYWCNRTKKFYLLEDITVDKDGNPLQFSKISSKILSEAKAKIKEVQNDLQKAVMSGDFSLAKQVSEAMTKFENDIETGAIYKK